MAPNPIVRSANPSINSNNTNNTKSSHFSVGGGNQNNMTGNALLNHRHISGSGVLPPSSNNINTIGLANNLVSSIGCSVSSIFNNNNNTATTNTAVISPSNHMNNQEVGL